MSGDVAECESGYGFAGGSAPGMAVLGNPAPGTMTMETSSPDMTMFGKSAGLTQARDVSCCKSRSFAHIDRFLRNTRDSSTFIAFTSTHARTHARKQARTHIHIVSRVLLFSCTKVYFSLLHMLEVYYFM